MTEAVGGIIEWAATQPHVNAVVAFTEKGNTASYTVLLKNGFQKTEESETMYKWVKNLIR
jgi:RimJ/RimL family protein N-acetyltransferase